MAATAMADASMVAAKLLHNVRIAAGRTMPAIRYAAAYGIRNPLTAEYRVAISAATPIGKPNPHVANCWTWYR